MRRFIRPALYLTLALCLLTAAAGAVVAVYCVRLSDLIDQRFSGRRWSIPSRVYDDGVMLYPGEHIGREILADKLLRLGYRRTQDRPASKGWFQIAGRSLNVFLHDITLPSRSRPGFAATITFDSGSIDRLIRTEDGIELGLLDLEPEEIMLFFGPDREDRSLVSLRQVPAHVISAVMAAEDARFYDHRGVDVLGILRALWTNLRWGEVRQGGSTITQQLAKNYFLSPEKTLSRKFREMLMAVTMEFMYTKDEILEIYLNEIYFGQKGSISINGIEEASRLYFNKSVGDLNVPEAATIAGIIRAPNLYSPYRNRERALDRRNTVLRLMHRHGWISEKEMNDALAAPIGTSGYEANRRTAPYFVDYVSEQLSQLYSPQALASLGLSLYTTLDTMVQDAAERALQKGLEQLEKDYPKLRRDDPRNRLQGAVVVLQPKTGHILAMVGGRDYNESQFNRAVQAKRQPGSAFKPFVYLTALDRFTPASLLSNEPRAYEVNGQEWKPANFDGFSGGMVRMRTALAHSMNLPTVDLALKIGLESIVAQAQEMGITTELKPYPALALGAFEVVPLELARAYCAFAADGVLPYPLSLTQVVDDKGNSLERRHVTIQRVMSPEKAYLMNSMLNSVTRDGTAHSLSKYGITTPSAGKTGTTNEYRDTWFVGYNPDILALVWVGFDNGDSTGLTGAKAALPIWAELMRSIRWQISGGWFNMPPGVETRVICADSGNLATANCPRPVEEVFLESNVPTQPCTLHGTSGWRIRTGFENRGEKFDEPR